MATIFKLHESEKEAAKALLSYAYLYDEEDGDTMEEFLYVALRYQQVRRLREEAQKKANRKLHNFKRDSKTQRVYEYIVANPGCRANHIEADLGIGGRNTRPIIKWLRVQGVIKPPSRDTWGRYYPAHRKDKS